MSILVYTHTHTHTHTPPFLALLEQFVQSSPRHVTLLVRPTHKKMIEEQTVHHYSCIHKNTKFHYIVEQHLLATKQYYYTSEQDMLSAGRICVSSHTSENLPLDYFSLLPSPNNSLHPSPPPPPLPPTSLLISPSLPPYPSLPHSFLPSPLSHPAPPSLPLLPAHPDCLLHEILGRVSLEIVEGLD